MPDTQENKPTAQSAGGGFFGEDDQQGEKNKRKPSLFSDIRTKSMIAGLVYIIGYSVLLFFAFECGKFSEYGLPMQMIEFRFFPILILVSVFVIISLSALVGIILRLRPNEKIRKRTKKLTDFFAAVSTLVIGTYLALVIYSVIDGNSFPIESIYAILVYAGTLSFYFLPKSTYFADGLIIAGFMVTLVVTSYYIGSNSAKMEKRILLNLGGKTYTVVSTFKDNSVFVRYSKTKKQFLDEVWLMNLRNNNESYDFYIQK